jgi:site-specific recombinase XerD
MDAADGRGQTEAAALQEREQAFWSFFRAQVADDGSSPVLMPGYRAHLTAWAIWCRDKGISPLAATLLDVGAYRRSMAAEEVPASVMTHKLLVLRRFYHAVVNAGLRSDNPALGIYPFTGC